MSKEKDDKTDLSSMSKEELITYLLSLEGQLKQQKEEAQKKERTGKCSKHLCHCFQFKSRAVTQRVQPSKCS